jgi:hypothetical protein
MILPLTVEPKNADISLLLVHDTIAFQNLLDEVAAINSHCFCIQQILLLVEVWLLVGSLLSSLISKFLETYLATAMFICSPPKLEGTVLVSSPHRSRASRLEEDNLNIIKIFPGRMQLFPSGKTTPWEHRLSVPFPKDMLS